MSVDELRRAAPDEAVALRATERADVLEHARRLARRLAVTGPAEPVAASRPLVDALVEHRSTPARRGPTRGELFRRACHARVRGTGETGRNAKLLLCLLAA